MQKMLIFSMTLLLIVFSTRSSQAKNIMTCYYPETCEKIASSEYSTGGGDSVIQYIELDCVNKNQEYVKYMDSMGSLSGAFGFGRLTIPRKIVFKKHSEDTLKCK